MNYGMLLADKLAQCIWEIHCMKIMCMVDERYMLGLHDWMVEKRLIEKEMTEWKSSGVKN